VGVESVSESDLSKILVSRPISPWKFWKSPISLSSEELTDDLLRIQQFYEARGYYHTKTDCRILEITKKWTSGPKAVLLPVIDAVFAVEEGPPTVVKKITLQIEQPVQMVSKVDFLERVPLKKGQVFEASKYQESKNIITKILKNEGYPFVKLKGRALIDKQANQADVHIEIEPGDRYTFGPLILSKKDLPVKKEVIQRAMDFKQGDVYAPDKIDRSQKNLYALDVFRLAEVRTGTPDPDHSEIPMLLEAKIKKRQSVSLGIGYGTEDGFRAKGAWTLRNLFERAGKFTLGAKRSDLVENLQAEYYQPYLIDAYTHLRSQAGIERNIFDSYTTRKVFAKAALDRDLSLYWKGAAGYNLEMSEIEKFGLDEIEKIGSQDDDYFISSIQCFLKRDTTDHHFSPTRGSDIILSYEQASELLGSEIAFLSPSLEMKTYYTVWKETVLAGRVFLQTIQEAENTKALPIFKKLFLGGSNTVRGYGYQQIPPLSSDEKPLGGQSLLNGNLELRYPIYQKISGVVFFDAGLLDEKPFRYDFGDLRFSCGTGIRYNTLIGPLRLDVGYKINPPTRKDIGYSTDEDQEIEERWRVHFSIGHAF